MFDVSSSSNADYRIRRIILALNDAALDQPVEIASWKVRTDLIKLTPKRWTGITRRSWLIEKTRDGERLVANTSKVMLWLEKGTGNAGTSTSHGGYIYPRSKKFLFVALTSRASIGGWNASLKYGTDYVLARRVRGIKAMNIIANYRPQAQAVLKAEVKKFLQNFIK